MQSGTSVSAGASARNTTTGKTLHIPSRETAAAFFRYYLLLSGVFLVVYGGTNYLTSMRSGHFLLYFDWEARIPFIPGFIYLYLSIFAVFLLPVFSLSIKKIRALAGAFLTGVGRLVAITSSSSSKKRRSSSAVSDSCLASSKACA